MTPPTRTPTNGDQPSAPVSYRIRRVAYEPEPGVVVPQTQTQVSAGAAVVGVPVEPVVSRETRERITRLVVVILEVLDGRRPLAAVAGVNPLVTPAVARYLRATMRTRAARSSRAMSVRVFAPRAGAVEVAAVCVIGRACRAVALRFERDDHPFDGHPWRVVALRVL